MYKDSLKGGIISNIKELKNFSLVFKQIIYIFIISLQLHI